MSISFAKYVNNSSVRSLDVFITEDTEAKVLASVARVEADVEGVEFLLDTLAEDDNGKYCIIGTLEFQYGFMSEAKKDVQKAYRKK